MIWRLLLIIFSTTNFPVIQSKNWRLVWSDEFDGSDINTSLWNFEEGNGCPILCGWGNAEMQWHTNRTENAFVDDGRLVIQARRETYKNEKYTAARMVSKSSWKFGRIEVKAKFPRGFGIMTNIWLLPAYNRYGIWPVSGEVDLAVMKSSDEGDEMLFNVIWGTDDTDKNFKETNLVNTSHPFSDEFYVYSLEWSKDELVWFVNGKEVNNFDRVGDVKPEYTYPFNERFQMVLSMAVGGRIAKGEPNDTPFPRRLEVDYIRVFQKI